MDKMYIPHPTVSTQQYVTRIDGLLQVVLRPDWYNDDKTPVSDELLYEHGYYLLVDTYPTPEEVDPRLFNITPVPREEWTLTPTHIEATYTISEKSTQQVLIESLESLLREIEAEMVRESYSYPKAEIETWHIQQKEVEAWALDNEYPTPFIDEISGASGENREDVIQSISTKVSRYMKKNAYLVGIRHKLQKEMESATTPSDILDVLDSYSYSEDYLL